MMTEGEWGGIRVTRLARYLFASVFLSAMLAAILSLLPGLWDGSSSFEEIPAFRPAQSIHLSETTLVDFLLDQPIETRILHADWQDQQLTLHLKEDRQRGEAGLYRDLFVLIKSGLVTAENVQSVRLNVYVGESQENPLSILANRTQLKRDPGMKNSKKLSHKQYIEEMFQFVPQGDI